MKQIYKYHYSLSEPFSQRFQNKYLAHICLMDNFHFFEVGLPGYKGQGQGLTEIKNKIFHNSNLSSTNNVTMFVFCKVTGDFHGYTTQFFILYFTQFA